MVLGSVSFLVVVSALSATIRVVVVGGQVQETARSAAVHVARHSDVESAPVVVPPPPGYDLTVRRSADEVTAYATRLVELSHPDGRVRSVVSAQARMPLAPFRSDRG